MSVQMILVLSVVFISIIIAVLIYILLIKGQGPQEVKKVQKDVEKRKFHIASLDLPASIEKIKAADILIACKRIYDVFVTLDYQNKQSAHLEANEWHTWQMSLLLKLYKYNRDLFIPEPKKIFHEEFLNISDDGLLILINDILRKYDSIVKISQTKDALCTEIKWSAREISIVFLFLSRYKDQ